ncbi:rhs family domain protein [Vibrio parahaemolyticus EKP-008]|nr:rhs family domain protein [Vibrio parahaemolyticus EKP-008]
MVGFPKSGLAMTHYQKLSSNMMLWGGFLSLKLRVSERANFMTVSVD